MSGIPTRRLMSRIAGAAPLMALLIVGAAGWGRPAECQPTRRPALRDGTAAVFSYAPGTRRYRLTTAVARTQNQAGGRAPFQFTNTTTMEVTLTLARRARDTLTLTLKVDSVSVSSDLDAPAADLSGYKGATLTGLISPQGRVYAFEAPTGAPSPVANLYRAFRRFLVPFPSGDVAPGTTWSDTTTTTVAVGGFDTRTVAITSSRIASDTTYEGQRAWRVDRTGTFTISGTATSRSDTTQLTGDGTMRATDYIALTGVFLGNTSTQTTQLQQFKANQPGVESTPIQQTINSKVEELGKD